MKNRKVNRRKMKKRDFLTEKRLKSSQFQNVLLYCPFLQEKMSFVLLNFLLDNAT
jgi:hypothetical protein